MPLAVIRIEPGEQKSEVIVTVASDRQQETKGREARDAAIAAAIPHIGPGCGIAGPKLSGYIPEGKDEPLTEREMFAPGAIVQGKGRWSQQWRVQGHI